MKKVSIVVAAITICALGLCGSSQAAPFTVNVASDVGVPVYGPSATNFLGIPSGTAGSSVALSPVDPTWPQAPNLPTIVGDDELTGAI